MCHSKCRFCIFVTPSLPYLKVSKFRKDFLLSSNSSKKWMNQFNLRSLYWKNHRLEKTLRPCLTFRYTVATIFVFWTKMKMLLQNEFQPVVYRLGLTGTLHKEYKFYFSLAEMFFLFHKKIAKIENFMKFKKGLLWDTLSILESITDLIFKFWIQQ